MRLSANKQQKNCHSNLAYIGLGSNLDAPLKQLQQALSALAAIADTKLVCNSSFYQSSPMGPQDQDDYLNAVALIRTALEPLALLDELQTIEQNQGRKRKAERWGARTLDLDLLLYNNDRINLPRLVVPHYGMTQRNFVLLPLAEIAPMLVLPDKTPLAKLIDEVDTQGIKKL